MMQLGVWTWRVPSGISLTTCSSMRICRTRSELWIWKSTLGGLQASMMQLGKRDCGMKLIFLNDLLRLFVEPAQHLRCIVRDGSHNNAQAHPARSQTCTRTVDLASLNLLSVSSTASCFLKIVCELAGKSRASHQLSTSQVVDGKCR